MLNKVYSEIDVLGFKQPVNTAVCQNKPGVPGLPGGPSPMNETLERRVQPPNIYLCSCALNKDLSGTVQPFQ